MINYETYLNEKNILTFEESLEIYNQLAIENDFNDETTKMLWNKLIESAVSYAAIRSRWHLYSREERMEKDAGRTASHNAFISSLNMFCRFQQKNGLSTAWREKLGDEKDCRKKIGDFACFIAYIYGINAR